MIDLPSTAPGKFHVERSDAQGWGGYIEGAGTLANMGILKPSGSELQLQYTTLAGYSNDPSGGFGGIKEFGFLAFGLPTPAGAVPVTGSATYRASVDGFTLDTNADGFPHGVGGFATLQLDFGAGTLAGSLNPILLDQGPMGLALGRYDFINTVFGVGSTTFSGHLSNSGLAQAGSFDGQFTGPAAQELMARWTAPYQTPAMTQPSEMFGVLVGKRQ